MFNKPWRLMLFDLEMDGHHASYIRYFLRYWPEPGDIKLVVAAEFLQAHPDLLQYANAEWHPVSSAEQWQYERSKASLLRHTCTEWQLFCRYAKQLDARQGLMMLIDRFQLPLALGLRVPCLLSGIYFRPKLHYPQLPNHRTTPGEQLCILRDKLLWRRALRHPQLKMLFTLDPLAVLPLQALGGTTEIMHLPDPIEICPDTPQVITRQQLSIDAERKILLLFGVLDSRKGIYHLLNALAFLSDEQLGRLTILLAGRVVPHETERLSSKINVVSQHSNVQIILRDQFVPEAHVAAYFALADGVLALYQREHVGSSGILLWAAALGKPVLAADHGLIGEVVRTRRLGLALASENPAAIAHGLGHFLAGRVTFDRVEAARFAEENSAEKFTHTLQLALLSTTPDLKSGACEEYYASPG